MDEDIIFKKTRIAPTPSGYLHLGNVLSFAITASLAKKTNAKIVLRIDDADRERTNKLYVQDIFDTLNFLEIPWDEGPGNVGEYEQQYSQLHRMDIYRKALQQLKESGSVFACTCSRADVLRLNADSIYSGTCRDKNLPLDTENASWRIRTDDTKEITVNTLQGVIKTILPASMQYFMVKKRDGFPAYQLTSLMDDVYFGIDLIVRGEDLWPSTLAQLYLATILGQDTFLNATFHHHPLIIGADGNKLSKSEGATSVHYLRKEGKKPADIYTMIVGMLGIEGDPGSWEKLVELLDIKNECNRG
ncbi:MAG: glutamate--tRNA ligase family protein [Chitinophagales bacterium]